ERAEDERELDLFRNWLERCTKRLDDADGLDDEAVQFGKHGRVLACFVILLVAFARNSHQPRIRKTLQLAMNRARASTGEADQLRALEPAFRLREKKPEDALLNRRKQGSCDAARRRCSPRGSHFGNDPTRFGNECKI